MNAPGTRWVLQSLRAGEWVDVASYSTPAIANDTRDALIDGGSAHWTYGNTRVQERAADKRRARSKRRG